MHTAPPRSGKFQMVMACHAAIACATLPPVATISCSLTVLFLHFSHTLKPAQYSCMRKECERAEQDDALPEIATGAADYIVRGYGYDDRIVYGSGKVTPTDAIAARADELLSQTDIAYIHVRSARNNCFQWRIERA